MPLKNQYARVGVWLALFSFFCGNWTPGNAETSQSYANTIRERLRNLRPERKQEQCFRTFGHERFCNCVAREIPGDIFFLEYVALSMSTDEELETEQMSAKQKEGVRGVRAAREKCVKAAFGN